MNDKHYHSPDLYAAMLYAILMWANDPAYPERRERLNYTLDVLQTTFLDTLSAARMAKES